MSDVATADSWTIARVLSWAADDLKGRGSETPRLDVELLLGKVLGMTRIQLIIDPTRPLSKEELAAYRELHKRRRTAEPVAYLLGQREFFGREFRVDARVLVPRPDTEILVEVGLKRLSDRSLSARVLDLCTGSGCVAITLACERPTWSVLGTDISTDALAVARDNAVRLAAVPRCYFMMSDLFGALEDELPYDLIVSNPPYIAESERSELPRTVVGHEPHLALFAGEDGLDVVRRLVQEAPKYLNDNGILALEIGYGQADRVLELLRERGFEALEKAQDYGRIERVVSGRWTGTSR